MELVPELLIKNIGMLATPMGSRAKSGKEQGEINIIEDAFITAYNGCILETGEASRLESIALGPETKIIDARKCLVTPGLVDSHTHLIFNGWRQKELSLKLKGVSYLEILSMGGGILETVRKTRKATLELLAANGKKTLEKMLAHGTTTCEVKSGYGLTVLDEIKSLQAVKLLQNTQPVELVPTFMGAHAIPEEYREQKSQYVDVICEQMIPSIAAAGLAEFCDVFCEDKAFDLAESGKILQCGKQYGLIPKIHADEITSLGGAQLAAQAGAISAEHLIYAGMEGLRAMAEAGTIAVLLPATSFYLGENFAQAKKMIELGIPVAIASDFNPGSSPNESLQLPMNLACLKYRMRPEEVLTAVTLNGAAAINRAGQIGTIEAGKQADVIIWDAPDLNYIFYHYGTNLVKTVIKKGEEACTLFANNN